MSKSNSLENAWLLLLLNNTNIANVGDATGLRGSTAAGSLYLSLHTADPTEAGSQTSSEAAYGGYARVAVARSSAGFTVATNTGVLTANADFPIATSGSETEFFFGLGTASSGAGVLLYSGPLGSNLGVCTAIAATDIITIPGLTGLAVNDRIGFFSIPGSTLPTGVAEGTVYFVKTVSGNDITISTTNGGATLDVTAAGAGIAFKFTGIVVTTNVTPRLTTGTTITED